MAEDAKTRVQYAEELVREFLLFRGFANTLRSFEADLAGDHAQAFQVDQILNLFFSLYIPRFESDKMHSLLAFLHKCFFSPLDASHGLALRKFETSLKRYYIIHALQKGRIDRVIEFFQRHGSGLLQSSEDWQAWFALPYIKSPHLDSRFQVYFSKEWLDILILSFGNFLNEVFNSTHIHLLLFLFDNNVCVFQISHHRIIYFMWMLAHGGLAVDTWSARLGCDPTCMRCTDQVAESSRHCLWMCTDAQLIWRAVCTLISRIGVFQGFVTLGAVVWLLEFQGLHLFCEGQDSDPVFRLHTSTYHRGSLDMVPTAVRDTPDQPREPISSMVVCITLAYLEGEMPSCSQQSAFDIVGHPAPYLLVRAGPHLAESV